MYDLRYTCLLPDLTLPPPDPTALVEYPDDHLLAVAERRLGAYAGVDARGVLVTCGASEGIEVAAHLWPDAVSLVLTPHVYLIDRAVRYATRKEPLSLPWAELDGAADLLARVARAARRHGRVILWLVCPNNPTGETIPTGDVSELLAIPGVAVVADESYYELSGWSVVSELPAAENLIVLRSFSKGFGLPGIRCGYLLCSPRHHRQFRELREPFRVAGSSLTYALAALAQRDRFEARWREVRSTRRELERSLRRLPLDVVASVANFVTVRFADEGEARRVDAACAARGIRLLGGWDEEFVGLSHDHLRLAVRRPLDVGDLTGHLAEITRAESAV